MTTEKALDHEISVWKRLRHPRILEFYGACSAADPPFFVCALKEGDAITYLRKYPSADRHRIVRLKSTLVILAHPIARIIASRCINGSGVPAP